MVPDTVPTVPCAIAPGASARARAVTAMSERNDRRISELLAGRNGGATAFAAPWCVEHPNRKTSRHADAASDVFGAGRRVGMAVNSHARRVGIASLGATD